MCVPESRRKKGFTPFFRIILSSLRKITKNRGSFPSDEALSMLFYLAPPYVTGYARIK
jgi:putative transposase